MLLYGLFLFTIYDEASVDHSRVLVQVIGRCLDQYHPRSKLHEPLYLRNVGLEILEDHTGRLY